MSRTVLDVRDLQVSLARDTAAVPIVRGVSFQLRAGRVLGLVGESGSGKSMTAFALMRLLSAPARIAGGAVRFKGEDLLQLSEAAMRRLRGNRMAMIFQDPMMTLNPVLTVQTQMVESVLAHEAVSRARARERAIEALATVGIPEPAQRLSAYPHEFSGGMRQRVAIAIALLHRPDVLIADEPTTALDVTIQSQILAEVQALAANHGTSVLWITHDLGVVAELADDIAVMYAGRLVETGPVEDVLRRPMHPYTCGLIGSLPLLASPGARLAQIPGKVAGPLEVPAGCAFRRRCAAASGACHADPPLLTRPGGGTASCFHPHDTANAGGRESR